MKKPIIAPDADGVLVDYGGTYAHVWQRAFGVVPNERDSDSYWPIDRWKVDRLAGESLDHFRRHFYNTLWFSIPALPGAMKARRELRDAGCDLVCASALESAAEGQHQLRIGSKEST